MRPVIEPVQVVRVERAVPLDLDASLPQPREIVPIHLLIPPSR